jgi:hypothetical protein
MIPKKFNVAIWLGLLSAFLWSGLAEAQTAAVNQKIELTVLAELQRRGEVTFFVVLKEQADVSRATAITDWSPRGQAVVDSLKQVADRTQRPILNFLANRNAEITPFWIVNTIKVRTSDELLIHQLAALPDVASISADETWQIPEPLPGVEELTIQGIEWGVVRVRAPEVWTQFNVRGEGIVVSNIDTGVQYDHPAVKTQYRGLQEDGTFDHNYNWHDPSQICGNPSLVPCDNTSHGTHTMGTAVGDDGGTNQIGVASRAKWIAAKGCETDSCSQSALLSSGQWVLAPTDLNGQNPRPDLRPHIVNNSWGGGRGNIFYQATVQAWRNAGIFPVFSIGNAGPSCNTATSPGDYPESFGVGAIDIFDNIASFSGRGPVNAFGDIIKPNVTAPGLNVRSSIPTNSYGSLSGTSMAAPHVTGVVALLWSMFPTLIGDISQTENILQSTAGFRSSTQCGSAGPPNNVYGWGIVDALAAAQSLTALSVSPTTVPAGGSTTATWSNIPSPTSTDWIGLYTQGAADSAYIDWIYVSCSKTPGSPQASGSCPFAITGDLTPGIYQLRLFSNNGFTHLATSNDLSVTGNTVNFRRANR